MENHVVLLVGVMPVPRRSASEGLVAAPLHEHAPCQLGGAGGNGSHGADVLGAQAACHGGQPPADAVEARAAAHFRGRCRNEPEGQAAVRSVDGA